ncbi:hypothetical protein P3T76_010002 [Phytophthora citrophthora]|uniref:OTU domain-containing protein n=1 Tax=Phytophthora citrophthora TaxID=4793 RepID=A0AAD9GDX3_9STRA|nr:hypothetical protein P3T76_010002 [Phytophthora citrophthora]
MTSQVAVEKEQVANTIPFTPRPALLIKVQRLIADSIEFTWPDTQENFVPSSTDARWESQVRADTTGAEILMQLGLHSVTTPATGNCQYYAVAMSLLDLDFDTVQHVEALEQLTRHLKEGIAEATRHGYEVEFPHDIRQTILVSTQLDVGDEELMIPETEEESNWLFQEYIRDIAHSPSTTSTYLPVELWGTEVTLRMMAKLLHQPIFVVIAPYGLQTTIDFQVYRPERVIKSGVEIDSAEQYYIPSSQYKKWFAQLQHANVKGNAPVVLLFSNSHYSRLQFAELPKDRS